jgi:pimeloyl-ACP methyl ester carboxylesterase
MISIEYGVFATMPFAAMGTGEPVVILAGLSPTTGVTGDRMVRLTLGPLARLADLRRLVVFNRRPGLPRGMTMAELAAEHADAIRAGLGDSPVDLVGTSTGGSIAQQIAADHPATVRRLLLISTACRLGPTGQSLQRTAAAEIRRGSRRRAIATMAAGLVPPRRGKPLAAAAAFLLAPRLIKTKQDIDDMATTIEAEDAFDLAQCPTVQAPTLLLAGRKDRFYTPTLFEETARLIPNARLHLFDGRGHITVMRDPGFQREVATFLTASP